MDGRDGPTPGGVRGPAKLGLCPWRVARQLRRAAAIGVVQVGNLLRVGNYRHRARVSDVILLALLGLAMKATSAIKATSARGRCAFCPLVRRGVLVCGQSPC